MPTGPAVSTPSPDLLLTLLRDAQQALAAGDPRCGLELADQCEALARAGDEPALLAEAKRWGGCALRDLGEVSDALRRLNDALDLYRAAHDLDGQASTLRALSELYKNVGSYEDAVDSLQASISLWRQLDRRVPLARTLNLLATVTRNLGDDEQAARLYEEAIHLLDQARDVLGAASARLNFGAMTLYRADYGEVSAGEYERAEALTHAALAAARQLGNPLLVAYALHNLGDLKARQGDLQGGLALLLEGRTLARAQTSQPDQSGHLISLARVYGELGDLRRAERLLLRALRLSRRLQLGDAQLDALHALVLLYERQARWQVALEFHREYHAFKSLTLSESARKRAELLAVRFELDRAQREAQLTQQHNVELQGVVKALHDMDQQRSALFEQLARQAERDPLTGLLHRASFEAELQRRLSLARRQGRWIGLLMVDVQDLNAWNLRFGHTEADELLMQLARRLDGQLPNSTVGHLGGGTFVVMVQLQVPQEGIVVRLHLVDVLSGPLRIAGQTLSASLSVKLHVVDTTVSSASEVLREAQRATAGHAPDDPPGGTTPARDTRPPDPGFTPREQAVARLLVQGLSNQTIADRLGLSERTARFHVSSLLGKLSVKRRSEAVTRLHALGFAAR